MIDGRESMRVAGVLTAMLIAAVTIGAAQQKRAPKAPPAKDACANPSTQTDFIRCSEKALDKADAALTRTYAALLTDLDADHKPILEKSQQAWAKFREAECALQSSESLGGSAQAQLYDECKAAMADERATALKDARKTLSEFI